MKKYFILSVIVLTIGSICFLLLKYYSKNIQSDIDVDSANIEQEGSVRIGYFHGGRTHLFFRAYINDYFEKENVGVRLFTKALYKDGISEVPKDYLGFKNIQQEEDSFGRMTGIEIVEEIEKGNLDGGTIGEASFVTSINNGSPIVAVATLGHDEKGAPAHAFLLRKGLTVKTPDDLKGKTFISRYSGPLDRVMVREFLESNGLRVDDVNIVDDVMDDELSEGFEKGAVDGGYYHFHWIKKFVNKDDVAYVYRKLDWVDPESSMALLVFHREYIEKNYEKVQKIVDAYVKRIDYEKKLSLEERRQPKEFGLQMVDYDSIEGMNIPQYSLPPKLNLDLLIQVQDLLLKYGEVNKRINIEDYLDHGFVDKAMKTLDK